jgi:hypothetical protein
MGITVDDIYRIESKLIGMALEREDWNENLHSVRTLELIRGIHTTMACVIAEIEKEQDT